MAVAEFLEDLVSHLPALQLLQQIGYQYRTPTEALELRGGRRSRVVLEPILIEQLRKLNQIRFKAQTHDFTASNLKNAVDALTNWTTRWHGLANPRVHLVHGINRGIHVANLHFSDGLPASGCRIIKAERRKTSGVELPLDSRCRSLSTPKAVASTT